MSLDMNKHPFYIMSDDDILKDKSGSGLSRNVIDNFPRRTGNELKSGSNISSVNSDADATRTLPKVRGGHQLFTDDETVPSRHGTGMVTTSILAQCREVMPVFTG
jgi:hypothetical protein